MRFDVLPNNVGKLSSSQRNDLRKMRGAMSASNFSKDTSDLVAAVAAGLFALQNATMHEKEALQSWAEQVSEKLDLQPPFDG